MRKKLVSILCVMALVVSLAGCGGGGSDSGSDGGGAEATTAGDVSDGIVRYTLTELPRSIRELLLTSAVPAVPGEMCMIPW